MSETAASTFNQAKQTHLDFLQRAIESYRTQNMTVKVVAVVVAMAALVTMSFVDAATQAGVPMFAMAALLFIMWGADAHTYANVDRYVTKYEDEARNGETDLSMKLESDNGAVSRYLWKPGVAWIHIATISVVAATTVLHLG